jgi:hypothetical protein
MYAFGINWLGLILQLTIFAIVPLFIVAYLGGSNSSLISLGLGALSCLNLFLLFQSFILEFAFIGFIAALSGFIIGGFGAFSARNMSPLMRYGGVILCIVGFMNIPFAIFAIIDYLTRYWFL